MEKINKYNYEAFFLDYFEGKLNSQQSEVLFHFLELNPELKTEFNSFENITLERDNIIYDEKNSLIKPEVTHHNYQKYLIAEAEGDLNINETRSLDSFLKLHPEYTGERVVYSKLKSTPDYLISFNLKEKLKKGVNKPVGKVIYMYRSIAVAASVLLAAFFFFQLNNNSIDEISLAANKKPEEINVDNLEKEDREIIIEHQNEVVEVNNHRGNEKAIKIRNKIQKVNVLYVEPKIAYTTPDKINSVISNEIDIALPEAPLFDVAEYPGLPDLTEDNETNLNLAQSAINVVENVISGGENNGTDAGTTAVELAAAGINKLTGKELVSFEKKYNEEGTMKKIQISAGNFGFSRSTSR
jgi:hypothetical protein